MKRINIRKHTRQGDDLGANTFRRPQRKKKKKTFSLLLFAHLCTILTLLESTLASELNVNVICGKGLRFWL